MSIDEKNFDSVFAPGTLGLLLFTAAWSGPGRALLGPLQRAAGTREMLFGEVDVDSNPQLAKRYGVRPLPSRYSDYGLPTVVLLRDGREQGRFSGHLSEEELLRRIDLLGSRQVLIAL